MFLEFTFSWKLFIAYATYHRDCLAVIRLEWLNQASLRTSCSSRRNEIGLVRHFSRRSLIVWAGYALELLIVSRSSLIGVQKLTADGVSRRSDGTNKSNLDRNADTHSSLAGNILVSSRLCVALSCRRHREKLFSRIYGYFNSNELSLFNSRVLVRCFCATTVATAEVKRGDDLPELMPCL